MNKFVKTVLLTGLFAGTTDIISAYITAYINSGSFPGKMFQYIAGGVLGLEYSLKGGNGVALLGLFIHYFISMTFTLFFFLVFPRLKFLWFNKYLVGILYGTFITLVMKFLVLPLTSLPPGREYNISGEFVGWITLGVIFGIPVAWNAYRYYRVPPDPLVKE